METSPGFRGNLAEKQFPEVLNHLALSSESGTLVLQNHSIRKSLYVENGKIIFAASNDPDDRLGPLLLRHNRVSLKQLAEFGGKVTLEKRLGTILVLQGILQPNDLYHAVLEQIKEIVFSIFEWNEGSFELLREPLPQKEVIVLNTPMPDLIMAGMMRISKWSTIQKALPSLETVYRKKEGWSPIVRTMSLTRETEELVDVFDRPRRLDEVLKISTLGNFETCRAVWAFLVLGIIEEILVAPQWSSETMDDSTARVEPPQTRTQEMPSASAETAGPTIKINVQDSPPPQAADPGEGDIQTLLDEQSLFAELSFSDLAELTDANEKDFGRPQHQPSSVIEPWEMKVLPHLKDFNEVHRYLFEMVALELGAGAHPFVGKVFRRASTKYPLVFEGVGMNDFGELDEAPLLSNIQSNLVQDYAVALDYLISEERAMIGLFLEMRRAEAIESGLKRILSRREQTVR